MLTKGRQHLYQSILNKDNRKKADANTIVITKIPTPFCTMLAGVTASGICKPEFCTMKKGVDLCKLSRIGNYGKYYYKYPTLTWFR